MYLEWKKDKRISISLLVNPEPLLVLHHLLRAWRREDMKFFIWLTLLMSMLFNNWRNMMAKNWRIVPRKVWNSINLKMKRRNSKNKRQPMSLFVNWSRKFLLTKSRKFNSDRDWIILLVFWSLANMVGVPIWKESWRLRLLEMPQWALTCFPKRPWKSTLTTLLFKNWRRKVLTLTSLTRPSEIWFGYCMILLFWLLVSVWMNQLNSETEFTEWLNWD